MHIPRYWAQARLRHTTGMRHGMTVQRWGWSDTSAHAAQLHAQQRAQQALAHCLQTAANPSLALDVPERMEWLNAYSLDGTTPIREEILEEREHAVMTRNSYGAQCLNTDCVAIADIDYPAACSPPWFPWLSMLLLVLGVSGLGIASAHANRLGWLLWCIFVGRIFYRNCGAWLQARAQRSTTPQAQAWAHIQALAAAQPHWGLRIYETPKGLRVIVTHAIWAVDAPEVRTLFQQLHVDPLYALLCQRQRCFRARVSGKPWRMGLSGLSSQQRQWPTAAAHQAARHTWVAHYQTQAQQFAACRWIAQLGPMQMPPAVQALVDWHDAASQAHTTLPLA